MTGTSSTNLSRRHYRNGAAQQSINCLPNCGALLIGKYLDSQVSEIRKRSRSHSTNHDLRCSQRRQQVHGVETAALTVGCVAHYLHLRESRAIDSDQREEIAVAEVSRALGLETARREGRHSDNPGCALCFV